MHKQAMGQTSVFEHQCRQRAVGLATASTCVCLHNANAYSNVVLVLPSVVFRLL